MAHYTNLEAVCGFRKKNSAITASQNVKKTYYLDVNYNFLSAENKNLYTTEYIFLKSNLENIVVSHIYRIFNDLLLGSCAIYHMHFRCNKKK